MYRLAPGRSSVRGERPRYTPASAVLRKGEGISTSVVALPPFPFVVGATSPTPSWANRAARATTKLGRSSGTALTISLSSFAENSVGIPGLDVVRAAHDL